MSDTHCPKHRVRWFDASPVATKPDHRCILCEIDRADAACEERDRLRKDSEIWRNTAHMMLNQEYEERKRLLDLALSHGK